MEPVLKSRTEQGSQGSRWAEFRKWAVQTTGLLMPMWKSTLPPACHPPSLSGMSAGRSGLWRSRIYTNVQWSSVSPTHTLDPATVFPNILTATRGRLGERPPCEMIRCISWPS